MNDIYIEQLVYREKSQKDKIRLGCSFFGIAIIILASLILFPPLFPILLFVGVFVCIIINGKSNIEYEYSYTNTELDVDCIYNKQKRKTIHSLDLTKSLVVYKSDNDYYKNHYKDAKIVDLSSGRNTEDTYVIVINNKDVVCKYIIEPNEKLLEAMQIKLGSRIFIK